MGRGEFVLFFPKDGVYVVDGFCKQEGGHAAAAAQGRKFGDPAKSREGLVGGGRVVVVVGRLGRRRFSS